MANFVTETLKKFWGRNTFSPEHGQVIPHFVRLDKQSEENLKFVGLGVAIGRAGPAKIRKKRPKIASSVRFR